jgi:hypothetical protein
MGHRLVFETSIPEFKFFWFQISVALEKSWERDWKEGQGGTEEGNQIT